MFVHLAEYWHIFIAALAEETGRKKTKKKYKEEEFLPAALEILERPPSPLGRAVLWTIMIFFVVAVFWGVLGRVDVVASASGKTLPRERVKVVQAPDIGVVRAIYVTDGQRVNAGDILIDLDPTNATADRAQAREQLAIAEIDLARGETLLSFINGRQGVFDATSADAVIAKRQQELINAQINEYTAHLEAFNKQSEERAADIEVTRSQIEKLQRTLPLVQEQVSIREKLLNQGYMARLTVIEIKERLVAMEQDLQTMQEKLVKARAAYDTVNRQIDQLREEFTKDVLVDITEAEVRVRLAREDLNKADLHHSLQSLKSPVDGVIQQLAVHTIGAIVKPADPLLIVVPGEGELIVQAALLNKDIGFVQEGDQAEIKLEAFPFTKYGVIDGVIEDISNDAVQNETLGLVYQVRVKLNRQTIRVKGREIYLSPGMAATTEIKIGTRRIIEFLLSPLLRYRDEAFRES